MSEATMQDKYLIDKLFDTAQKSVEANQSSAAANTKNAEATAKLQALVSDQVLLSTNLHEAVHEVNDTMKEVVKGLETIAASQKVIVEITQKEKEKYFKLLTYSVIIIIIVLGGGAVLKVFFGFDFTALFK